MTEMFRGAEAYLEMWERAEGVSREHCLAGRELFDARGRGATAVLGEDFQRLLTRAGQPLQRTSWSYRYCAGGASARNSDLRVAFDPRSGRISLIASSARSARAGGIVVGQSTSSLSRRAVRLGTGLWWSSVTRAGSRYIFGTRAGVVDLVGVVSSAAATPSAVRDALASAGF